MSVLLKLYEGGREGEERKGSLLLSSWKPYLNLKSSWSDFVIDLQECIVVLAKLLLTQEFEKTSIPDLRTLFLERSSIITYIAGEAVEIWNESIGFLLEGLLRTPDLPSVAVESPAALLPSQESPNSSTPEAPGSSVALFDTNSSILRVTSR